VCGINNSGHTCDEYLVLLTKSGMTELHIQISEDGRYLVDLHVQDGVRRWCDMQLVVVELGQ
jgi:hypothetical protein